MEYAITAGEGTLIDYGYFPYPEAFLIAHMIDDAEKGRSTIVGPADEDCQTGK